MKRILAALLFALSSQGLAEHQGKPQDQMSLNGLWAISLGADFSFIKSEDVQAESGGSATIPETQVFPGIHFSVRKHMNDTFYGGAGLSTIPRAYDIQVSPNETKNYDWNAVYPFFLGAWVWYRGLNLYSYIQAEAGVVFLNQASFRRTGSNAEKRGYEGSAFATAISLGGVWMVIPSAGLNVEGGYRRASLDSVSSSSGPNIAINDSGPYGRLGISFFWGMKNPWGEGAPLPVAPEPPQTESIR